MLQRYKSQYRHSPSNVIKASTVQTAPPYQITEVFIHQRSGPSTPIPSTQLNPQSPTQSPTKGPKKKHGDVLSPAQ